MAPERFWDLDHVHGLSIFLPLGEDLELGYVITETSPITPSLIVSRNLRLREMYTSDQLQFVGGTPWKALIDTYYSSTSISTNVITGPIGGLQEPDVTPPQSLIIAQGQFTAGQPISLTWTASDTQTGVMSTTLWRRVSSGSWSSLFSQIGSSGSFSFTLPIACTSSFSVRAVDKAGNVEPIDHRDNMITINTSYCVRLPVIYRS